jgi:DNA polymerase sigma
MITCGSYRHHRVILLTILLSSAMPQVPIIKTTIVGLGPGSVPLPADISIGVANGAAAVAMVRRAVLDLPPLRPLCLTLKSLLRESGERSNLTEGHLV